MQRYDPSRKNERFLAEERLLEGLGFTQGLVADAVPSL